MSHDNTRDRAPRPYNKMTFAAFMAALAVLFGMVYMMVPMFGGIMRFFVAVPLAVAMVVSKERYGILAAVVATGLFAVMLGPMAGLSFLFLFAGLGVVSGVAFVRNASKTQIFVSAIVVQVIGLIGYAGAMYVFTGMDLTALQTEMSTMKTEVMQFYRDSGMLTTLEQQSMGAAAMLEGRVNQMLYWMIRLIPATMVLLAIAQVAMHYWASSVVLRRMNFQQDNLAFPYFRNWHIPGVCVWPLIVAWGVILLRDRLPWDLLQIAAANVLLVFGVLAMIDGLSLLAHRVGQMGPLMKVFAILFIVFFFNGVAVAAAVTGVFDMLLDFRGKQRSLFKK